jgi:hypothetical protein
MGPGAVQSEECGVQSLKAEAQRPEVVGRRTEVGGRRSEVGGQRSEVGGQRLGHRTTGPRTTGLRRGGWQRADGRGQRLEGRGSRKGQAVRAQHAAKEFLGGRAKIVNESLQPVLSEAHFEMLVAQPFPNISHDLEAHAVLLEQSGKLEEVVAA